MSSFSGNSRPDRPNSDSRNNQYSLFPHPAASMFGRPSTGRDLLDDTDDSEKLSGKSLTGRLTTMKEEDSSGDNQSSSGASSRLDFSGITKAIQETSSAPPSIPRSSFFKKDPSLVRNISTGSNYRAELKTVHSGRSLVSIDSGNGASPTLAGIGAASAANPPSAAATPPSPDTKVSSSLPPPNEKQSSLRRLLSNRAIAARAGGALKTNRLAGSATPRTNSSRPSAASSSLSTPSSAAASVTNNRSQMTKRYQIEDLVLVSNHQSRWANLVNQYGFPPSEGYTAEEQRGPYLFVLATVQQIHYDEFAVYYTVERADSGAEQRADTAYMEPIRTEAGLMAAQRAATTTIVDTEPVDGKGGATSDHITDERGSGSFLKSCGAFFVVLAFPFFLLGGSIARTVRPVTTAVLRFIRKRAVLILNGEEPFACQMRWTAVNFVVLCSTWYMFIDQARLALFPPEADDSLAMINFVVWLVLLLELVFEVLIRPDGYHNLILSDKAFAPTIARYINTFHLVVESFSLALFIPEFICLFTGDSCSARLRFSFHNAVLIAVTGPSRRDILCGRAFLALIRLRVFGMVRHWKTMWINTTFVHNYKRNSSRTPVLSALFPHLNSKKNDDSHSRAVGGNGPNTHVDETLTNASTIGTALMVTNSYRALITLWIVLGIFPMVFSILNSYSNRSPTYMTSNLLETNLIIPKSNPPAQDCGYWLGSIFAWATAVTAPDVQGGGFNPYLLSLQIEPKRCYQEDDISELICNTLAARNFTGELPIDEICRLLNQEGLNAGSSEMAAALGLRVGSVVDYVARGGPGEEEYIIRAFFDQTFSIVTAYVRVSGLPHLFSYGVLTYASYVLFVFFYCNRARGSLLLQLCMFVAVLGGLSVMRRDAEVLVLGPLRRMLKIVARYAKNPLSQPKIRREPTNVGRRKTSTRSQQSYDDDTLSDSSSESSYGDQGEVTLGSYETEQLITAVTSITDLLRKCWGVAGADIISTNLASTGGALTEVFNPTVPGKSVYALFGFATINGFDHAMRSLGDDLIDLINNVAKVLHEEVFRWGFGDSGQCNKNLGSAFLMVFRIGLVKEVIEKLEQATDVIFSGSKASQEAVRRRVRHSHSDSTSGTMSMSSTGGSNLGGSSGAFSASAAMGRRSSSSHSKTSSILRSSDQMRPKAHRNTKNKAMSLNLASLPGISTFTDRAVIGMLKSFACMYRDKDIRKWNKDFRLGAGVGAFTVSIFYGMDAGWAVEGAVGSRYKIDATYLSPHVNMASRMMSACKQYGVSILLSQAVAELMSDAGRSKLRHLDTVTVKGSSVKQKIFTYDARNKGVDFFLFGRSDEQADMDAERYSTKIWNTDQDLKSMRQHITDDFMQDFNSGLKSYIGGDWPAAIKRLERANEIMIEDAVEQGYLEDEFDAIQMQEGEDAHAAAEELKRENGDGPCLYLISYMRSQGGVAPKKWEGWHPLTKK